MAPPTIGAKAAVAILGAVMEIAVRIPILTPEPTTGVTAELIYFASVSTYLKQGKTFY